MLPRLVMPLCLLAVSMFLAQSSSPVDFLADKDMPGAFISFDRIGAVETGVEGQTEQRIWLRFHNNYKFPITLKTFPLTGDDPMFVSKGSKSQIGVVYQIKSTNGDRKKEALPEPDIVGHVFTAYPVESGEEVVFSVPAQHLSGPLYILVPFEIASETFASRRVSAPQHFAVFYGASLTRAAPRQR
jgi:hypothetical protein